jgi:hypothetical protein
VPGIGTVSSYRPTIAPRKPTRVLVQRANALEGCTEGSKAELKSIVDAIEAYEAIRWPTGKVYGGKG